MKQKQLFRGTSSTNLVENQAKIGEPRKPCHRIRFVSIQSSKMHSTPTDSAAILHGISPCWKSSSFILSIQTRSPGPGNLRESPNGRSHTGRVRDGFRAPNPVNEIPVVHRSILRLGVPPILERSCFRIIRLQRGLLRKYFHPLKLTRKYFQAKDLTAGTSRPGTEGYRG